MLTMKTFHTLPLAAALLILTASTAHCQDPAALEEQIANHVQELKGQQDTMRCLSMTMTDSLLEAHEEHIWHVHFRDRPTIVVEEHREDGIYMRKDYYLQDSKVIAFMTELHEPTLDENTERVSECAFGFHEGRLIAHSVSVYRRALNEEPDPNLAAKNEKDLPILPGFDAFQQQLTQRAFDIAHQLTAIPQQEGLASFLDLREGPPASVKALRAKDWLPSAGTLTLPVRTLGLSSKPVLSPDGRFGVSWGYRQGPVDWAKLRSTEPYRDGEFSTRLQVGSELTEALQADTTFIRNAVSGQDMGCLGLSHGGEVERFNHDGIVMHWSPSCAMSIAQATQRPGDSELRACWINGKTGAITSQDLLSPLSKAVLDHVAKSTHPAAKNARDDTMPIRLGKILLEDDGKFEASISATIRSPRVAPENYFEAKVYGQVSPSKSNEEAEIKLSEIKLAPPLKAEE